MTRIPNALARIVRRPRARPMIVVSDGTIGPREAERLIPQATMLCLRLDALAITFEEFRSDHGWNDPGGTSRSLSNVRSDRAVTLYRTLDRNSRLASSPYRRNRRGVATPWSRREALALPWPITVILQDHDLTEIAMDGTTRDGIRIGDTDDRSRRTIHDLAVVHHARIARDTVLCLKAIADGTTITTEQTRAVMTTMGSEMIRHAAASHLTGVGMRLADRNRGAALTARRNGELVSLREAPGNPFVAGHVVFRSIGMKDGIVLTRTPFAHIDATMDVMALMRAAVVDAEVRDLARRIGALPR